MSHVFPVTHGDVFQKIQVSSKHSALQFKGVIKGRVEIIHLIEHLSREIFRRVSMHATQVHAAHIQIVGGVKEERQNGGYSDFQEHIVVGVYTWEGGVGGNVLSGYVEDVGPTMYAYVSLFRVGVVAVY